MSVTRERFGTMSIDEVSKELGALAADMKQQTKLISKLFDKLDERDKGNAEFRQEFREHANDENVRFKTLEDFVNAEKEKIDWWKSLRTKSAFAAVGLMTAAFLTWFGSVILEQLHHITKVK